MTSAHIIFIPGVLTIGMFVGFILGARAARNSFDAQARRDADREVARATRAAKRAAAAADQPAADPSADKSV
jgi:hypothetical protein